MNKKDTIPRLTLEIKNEALRLGFAECGISRVRPLTEAESVYNSWINNKYHASMEYMENNVEKRIDPAKLVEGAKSVILLLCNYYSDRELSQSTYKIARYAYGSDYHDVIKEKLRELESFIKQKASSPVIQRSFVDSAPVLERAWAQESGLGWIGKNSCLISRRHGSFVFIAEIITSLELDYDEPLQDYCGNCNKCIDACPTNAIKDERVVDSNLCISYQTIENRGEIPQNLGEKFNGYIFGCDICQEVCPWNTKAHEHSAPLFHLRPEIQNLTVEQWETMQQEDYQRIFRKSAVKRTKFNGLKRNIEFVKGNVNK